MIHVMEFISSLGAGGAESLIADYMQYINPEFFKTTVVMRYHTVSVRNKEVLEKSNTTVVGLTKSGDETRSVVARTLIMVKTLFGFRKYVKDNPVEVLHTHLENNKYLYFARKYLKNTKLIYTVHNEPQKVFEGSFNNRIDYWFTKQLIKKQRMQLIALHDEMRVELNQLFGVNNTLVFNNGIDLSRFQAKLYQADRPSILSSLGFHENDFIVGHVGRFAEQKNHQFLLDVFLKLLLKKPNAKLLLIGSGPLKAGIMARVEQENIADKVVVLENRSDIPQLMSVMDIFLFPSLFEGLSVTLVEAQSMGIKCVVSDSVSQATHLTDRFIPISLQENADIWCKAIIDDTNFTTPQGELKGFDIKNIVKQLEKVYQGDL